MALREVCRLHPPAAHTSQTRPHEADRQSREPQCRPEPTVDERGGEDKRAAEQRRAGHPRDGSEQIRFVPARQREQPDEHHQDNQERQSKDETMTPKRFRNSKRRDEHRPHRRQDHRHHQPRLRVNGIRQPRVTRPRPPQHRQ